MSRYYFHATTADGEFQDDVGVEFDDHHSCFVRMASMAGLEAAAEVLACGEELTVFGFRVVDDLGQTVLELPLSAMAVPSRPI